MFTQSDIFETIFHKKTLIKIFKIGVCTVCVQYVYCVCTVCVQCDKSYSSLLSAMQDDGPTRPGDAADDGPEIQTGDS